MCPWEEFCGCSLLPSGSAPGCASHNPPPNKLALRTQFNLPLSLFQLNNGGLRESLKGNKVVLAIEGSRHFRLPPVGGAMRYEGCAILVMERGTQVDGDAFMKNTASSARRFEKIAGLSVAAFEELTGNGAWTTFDYDKSQARLDPTSPFENTDPRAVGVTFYFEPFERKQALITYLSGTEDYRSVLLGHLSMADADAAPQGEFQIHFRQPGPGALQGSVSLSPAEALYRLLFGLAAMLGHGASV